jgi:hypothetical protein
MALAAYSGTTVSQVTRHLAALPRAILGRDGCDRSPSNVSCRYR